jgi:peptidoglycan/LPS O-acetylase OafA/YrhL
MKPRRTIHSLQELRALAAWLVVIDHTLLELTHNRIEDPLTHLAWTLGSSGVSVFFVISGFIMVHICWGSFGRGSSTLGFLARRVLRIVPLYWLATFAALAYHRISATHGANDGWADLVRSLTFIPYAGSENSWSPILPQGWTLTYEMIFYLIFAVGLSFRRGIALPAIALSLATLVVLGPAMSNPTATFIASPILLWFILGMALATLWHWQGLEEPGWLGSSSLYLERFGNASYSTYLCHGFILTMLLRLWIVANGSVSVWIVPASFLAATAAGLVTHAVVERPILRLLASSVAKGHGAK